MRGQLTAITVTQQHQEDNIMDDDHDDDDDTVVGNCLHCNAPPPPRSSEDSDPDSAAATRVQVSCDDCRSFICDGAYLSVIPVEHTYLVLVDVSPQLLLANLIYLWTCKP